MLPSGLVTFGDGSYVFIWRVSIRRVFDDLDCVFYTSKGQCLGNIASQCSTCTPCYAHTKVCDVHVPSTTFIS